jgi:hypothetical protein
VELKAVFRIRIRIRKVFGPPGSIFICPDQFWNPDSSINKQKIVKNLDFYSFGIYNNLFSFMNDVNVPSVSDRQKKLKRKNSLFIDIWKLAEEKSRIRSRIESNV